MGHQGDVALVAALGQLADLGLQQGAAEGIGRLVDGEAGAVGGDLEDLTVGVLEVDALEVAALVRAGDGDAVVVEPALPPELLLGIGDAHSDVVDSADSPGAAGGLRPLEEGQEGAGGAGGVAEVEVVGVGHVEVDGLLDQAEAEDVAVEVEGALGVLRDHGDVMEALSDEWGGRGSGGGRDDWVSHGVPPC